MRVGYREACLDHDTGDRHPESPRRLRAIRRALAESHDVEYVAADDVDDDRLRTVHESSYVEEVQSFCADGGGNWDVDTVASEGTWGAVLAAAGLAEWAAERALAGDDGRDTPFAVGRPPGHHAMANDANGFCFFNNAAIAADAARDAGADRVAIVDWDVHHGDGTQNLTEDDEAVFYASFHQADLYPGTGPAEEIGPDAAPGTVANVPFPAGSGDPEYDAAMASVVGPAIEAFDPDLILVSAGFDAHERDPISQLTLSTEGYARLAAATRDLAEDVDAGLAYVLEGGYDHESLTDSIRTIDEVMAGYEPTPVEGEVDSAVEEMLADLRERHELDE